MKREKSFFSYNLSQKTEVATSATRKWLESSGAILRTLCVLQCHGRRRGSETQFIFNLI